MDSCNGVLRARADTYLPLRLVGVSNQGLVWSAFFRCGTWLPGGNKLKEELSMILLANGRLITRDSQTAWATCRTAAWSTDGGDDRGGGQDGGAEGQVSRGGDSWTPRAASSCPALINAHTHIYSALARGLSIDGQQPHQLSTRCWTAPWWDIDRHLTLDGTRASAYAAGTWTASSRASPPSSTTTPPSARFPAPCSHIAEVCQGIGHPGLPVL